MKPTKEIILKIKNIILNYLYHRFLHDRDTNDFIYEIPEDITLDDIINDILWEKHNIYLQNRRLDHQTNIPTLVGRAKGLNYKLNKYILLSILNEMIIEKTINFINYKYSISTNGIDLIEIGGYGTPLFKILIKKLKRIKIFNY